MGYLSGCLVSTTSIQKLYCGICSKFKWSFNEFVGETVVSPSYASTILGPPPPTTSEFSLCVCVCLYYWVLWKWKCYIKAYFSKSSQEWWGYSKKNLADDLARFRTSKFNTQKDEKIVYPVGMGIISHKGVFTERTLELKIDVSNQKVWLTLSCLNQFGEWEASLNGRGDGMIEFLWISPVCPSESYFKTVQPKTNELTKNPSSMWLC